MSGLQARADDAINGVDVREQGNALRVATNTPHLVSLGTGRLSTAVTLHPIKQGRVTIGSDPTCDIYVAGTGVSNLHCRVENSHGVVTLYPVNGSTLLDGLPVDKATRLSQGSMLTIGRSNYLRFNHPEEAKLMKSVLPTAHLSMAPIQFQPNDKCVDSSTGYGQLTSDGSLLNNQCYQNQNINHKIYKENPMSPLELELDMTIKEMGRRKPPVAPRKPYRDLEFSDSNSDQEQQKPKLSNIMAKVSKFEYYAKSQQKNISRSQFYTSHVETNHEISPKVFSSNSLTVNTPAKDVLGGKNAPTNYTENNQKVVIRDNNATNGSYVNVAIRSKNKIDDIVRNFDENSLKALKKINNDQQNRQNIYGKIEKDLFKGHNLNVNEDNYGKILTSNEVYGRTSERGVTIMKPSQLPSSSYDRNPQYSPVYANSSHFDRSYEAESKRMQAYQDRIKEEEQKEAENARLEEILNMCAEYEKQIAAGIPVTPTEKRSQNKIITNGSLPRSVALNNPNFIQTSEGYYKFDTSHSNTLSKSLPVQRNLSSYENIDISQMSPTSTTQVTRNQSNYENVGRIDDIGIPINESRQFPTTELASPFMVRKFRNDLPKIPLSTSPIKTPYENLHYNRSTFANFKPKSPNTQSPRTRIKTTFAHKNLPSPQYFIFPTPPPIEDDSKKIPEKKECLGIEKQLSLEEEIPMIDDVDITNDIELRYSQIERPNEISQPIEVIVEIENVNNKITKNKSFEDVKKELMADIPELEEFERDLEIKKDKILNYNAGDKIKTNDILINYNDGVDIDEVKVKYDRLKEHRRTLLSEIHEIKCNMSEIRSQEDDILRELEMEKALIKGEYDSEIAILNIEQRKKCELSDKAKKIEEDIRKLKEKQESRQNDMRERVEIATLKVERIEKDLKDNTATMEELQNAQDILDNETKIYEDLEFRHLEEESEMLAVREDLQNDIIILTKKIEAQKSRILTLKSEANNNLTSALRETKTLQAEYVNLLNKVEGLTSKVQEIEKQLKPLVIKLNDVEGTQSPDSAFYTDARCKSGEFSYSPQTSDSDDSDLSKIANYDNHRKQMKDKFNSIDQMSQSMTVDIERRDISDLIDEVTINYDSRENSISLDNSQKSDRLTESPSKSSTSSKEKKGFWERNFDSLSRLKNKDRKSKAPSPKIDIMSQSLNENMFYNDNIETDCNIHKFNSLKLNKKKDKNESNGVIKNRINNFGPFGMLIKKDSFSKRNKENDNQSESKNKNRYVKNSKSNIDNKYTLKAKSQSTDGQETPNQKGHNVTFDELIRKSSKNHSPDEQQFTTKLLHRKSCGDEPSVKSLSEFHRISDSGKIPSQDDIDRISKVTLDAPILSSDTDMNSLGRRTLDSFMEIERKRLAMLEEQGCQVIENEREKISELKRRVQDEAKKLWDKKIKSDQRKKAQDEEKADSIVSNSLITNCDIPKVISDDNIISDNLHMKLTENSVIDEKVFDTSLNKNNEDTFNITNSTVFEESSGFMSSSIEELQVRHSRTDSFNSRILDEEKRSNGSRPLSDTSDISNDNILGGGGAPRRSRRTVAPYTDSQRPLTRYLPVDRDDFDLRRHIESAGHQVDLCPNVTVDSWSCRGYLHKLGAKFHTWSKRWFVFDRNTKTFVYYWDKTERKPRGGAYFQVIEEVYLDHSNTSKSPNPQTTFVVKTRQRRYYLMSPSGEAARIWIDVIFTGAQGYTEYLE